ncbi:MAG: hypothetical protein A3H91_14645 [Gammaproteobacteria bacterium RIFCSPLOWO2_02_FULL_61_13]|nr:MAG: hypothetical protein A3H91_14645 [Gammaproteobacteria bacterium RIFCSPLOWO2_02_FULL_61_13]
MINLQRELVNFAISMLLVTGTAHAADGVAVPAAVEVDGATIGRLGDPAVVNPHQYKFSEAESGLWLADHLQNISKPTRLKYEFVRSGTYEEGFADVVLVDIKKLNDDGSKNADMQFFTGERAQPFSPDTVTEIRGNPVLGVYMRGDVYDMSRLTDGSWRYFQRRIKLALSESATVEPVEIAFAGKKVKALRIVITPFAKDPHRAQFEQFTGKRYEFTLSKEVPGTLYEIRSVVPGASAADAPLLEERLTLTQVGAVGAAGASP